MAVTAIPFNNSYAQLPGRFFEHQNPDPVTCPELIRLNSPLCEILALDVASFSSRLGADIFSGNIVPSGAEPIALVYAGHQFGGWSPQLGDGRAVLLGEIMGVDGVRRDIQLKGSGRTPFSRRGDGRAALGPILREYIVSEAMHALGVPTTRALAAVTTGQDVLREGKLPGAILTRVAQSHVRIGTFEYFAARRDSDAVRILADYVIDRHYPDAKCADRPYLGLLNAVIERQVKLIVKWFQFGFIHGVMNTDNTSVVGETIDYGPCAFMDTYHPEAVFSSIDHMGRYAFGNQSSIMQWNLAQFTQCLLPLLDPDPETATELAQTEIDAYPRKFETALNAAMCAKLGLKSVRDEDLVLGLDLLDCMAAGKVDFTNTFRNLANIIHTNSLERFEVKNLFNNSSSFNQWVERWLARLAEEARSPEKCATEMRQANPAVIPRNHLVEAAIRAAEDEGNFGLFNNLVDEVVRPFETRASGSYYIRPPSPDEVVHNTYCGT